MNPMIIMMRVVEWYSTSNYYAVTCTLGARVLHVLEGDA
jgi:hypothetical protein